MTKIPQITNEPDEKIWTDEATGYDCVIVRNHMKAFCGYVRVPEGHQFFSKNYDHEIDATWFQNMKLSDATPIIALMLQASSDDQSTIRLDLAANVHGGITWANDYMPTADDRKPGEWWFGFDCAHAGDYVPGMPVGLSLEGTYRDIDYVTAECEKLAAFLKRYGEAA